MCACTERGFVEIWSGHLLIKNLASVAKTYARLFVTPARRVCSASPFLRSDSSKVVGCLKARVSRRLHDTLSSQHAAVAACFSTTGM